MPIIILTASDGEEDIIRGLEAGANDYMAKPFYQRIARAASRSFTHIREQRRCCIPGWPLHLPPGEKAVRGFITKRRIWLTEKEVAIMKYLYRLDARSVSRQKLLHEVWGYNPAATTHTLETHIYRLRMKIEGNPAKPLLLVTDSQGYRLDARGGTSSL